jgi:signal transduction histidine kinase
VNDDGASRTATFGDSGTPLARPRARHPRSDDLLRLSVCTAGIAVAYFITARLGFAIDPADEPVALVWPPSGIAMTAVLLLGRTAWPAIWIGAFGVNALAAMSLLTAASVASGNTLGAILASEWLRQFGWARPALDQVRAVLAFIAIGAFGKALVSATFGVLSLGVGGVQPWASVSTLWLTWFLGDTMGVLVVGAGLLVWSQNPASVPVGSGIRLVLVSAGVAGLVFGVLREQLGEYPLQYLLFPIVIWAALSLRQHGTTAALAIVSAIAIWGTREGFGPFWVADVSTNLALLQLFLGALTVTGLVLAAAMAEREAAQRTRLALLRTEQQARAEANALNRAKDEFLAMLGHELRNPLGAISNAAAVLERGPTEPQARAMQAVIARQTRHVTRLLDDLLDVARLTKGKITLKPEPVWVLDVVDQCVALLRQNGRVQGHQLTRTGPHVVAHADPVRLAQILMNLLDNALKYTAPGGGIEVSVAADEFEVVTRVRDTGQGIPSELLPHVFEPFTQARGHRQHPGGLGLGLSLVHRLVELHGGRVTAHSAGVGQGSEFVVRLPRTPAQPALTDDG